MQKILLTEPFEDVEIFSSPDEAGSSITLKSREQIPIAPTTTVTHSASPRVQVSKGFFGIFETSSSNETSPDKLYSLSEDLELNVTLTNEEYYYLFLIFWAPCTWFSLITNLQLGACLASLKNSKLFGNKFFP